MNFFKLYGLIILMLLGMMPQLLMALEKPQFGAQISYDYNQFEGAVFDADTPQRVFRESYFRKFKFSYKQKLLSSLKLNTSVEYKEEDQSLEVEDLYFGYQWNATSTFYLGKFKEPQGLEFLQSSKTLYLTERSAPTQILSFERSWGAMLEWANQQTRIASAIMSVDVDNIQKGDVDRDNRSTAYFVQASWHPWVARTTFGYLGIGYSQRALQLNDYELKGRLIAYGAGNRVESMRIDLADELKSTNLEGAVQWQPVLLQTEYFQQLVQDQMGKVYHFDGHYVTALWTVLGKPRQLKKGRIQFSGSAKKTLELAYRVAAVDALDGQKGNVANAQEWAINFYLKNNLRLSLEYQQAELAIWKKGEENVVDGHSINTRIQFAF